MLARCADDAMNACWICDTLPPTPTFSPIACQQQTSLVADGLCASVRLAAMCAAQRFAIEVRSELTTYDRRPCWDRAALVSETNCALDELSATANAGTRRAMSRPSTRAAGSERR